MKNIFQDNRLIQQQILKSLGLELKSGVIECLRFRETMDDLFFSSYFYLTQRFGLAKKYDEYKDAGVWSFIVKDFEIEIRLDSTSVLITMFGSIGYDSICSPYLVRKKREILRHRCELIDIMSSRKSEQELKLLDGLWDSYSVKHGINKGGVSDDVFQQKYLLDFVNYVEQYNQKILNIHRDQFTMKYGAEYKNAYTKRALRVLDKFLKSMLCPIWIRDVPYNIKGVISNNTNTFKLEQYAQIQIMFNN